MSPPVSLRFAPANFTPTPRPGNWLGSRRRKTIVFCRLKLRVVMSSTSDHGMIASDQGRQRTPDGPICNSTRGSKNRLTATAPHKLKKRTLNQPIQNISGSEYRRELGGAPSAPPIHNPSPTKNTAPAKSRLKRHRELFATKSLMVRQISSLANARNWDPRSFRRTVEVGSVTDHFRRKRNQPWTA